MTTEDRKEAIRYINSQLEYGYIDLGTHDTDEIEIIKEAMALLEVIDKFCDIGRVNTNIVETDNNQAADDELRKLFVLNDARVEEMIEWEKKYGKDF